MNKEEAIKYLKNLIKNPTISQDPFYPTKIAIDIVSNYIEKLENMYKKEYNEHIEMKRQNEVLRNNERILKEKIEELENKNKDLCINYCPKYKELEKEKQQILDDYQELGKDLANNFISKDKVRDKIEETQKQYEETLKTANFKEIETMNKTNFKGIMLEGQRTILKELLKEGD